MAFKNSPPNQKSFPITGFKALDASKGIGEFFVSVFNVVDHAKERVRPGFFKDSIAYKLPKSVWMHDWSIPIGKTLIAEEVMAGDARLEDESLSEAIRKNGGLYIQYQANLDTQRGKEAWSDLNFGSIDEFSFGYDVDISKLDQKTGVRDLIKGFIYEWSPVLWGCNPHTQVLSMKSRREPMMAGSVEPKKKSQYLGSAIENQMTIAAIRTLNCALFYDVIYRCVCGDADYYWDSEEEIAESLACMAPIEQRCEIISAAIDEFKTIALATVRAFLSDPETEEGKSANLVIGEQIKSLWQDPKALDLDALKDGNFKEHSESLGTAVGHYANRVKWVHERAIKEQKGWSDARLEELKTARAGLLLAAEALHEIIDEKPKKEAEEKRIQLKQRLLAQRAAVTV